MKVNNFKLAVLGDKTVEGKATLFELGGTMFALFEKANQWIIAHFATGVLVYQSFAEVDKSEQMAIKEFQIFCEENNLLIKIHKKFKKNGQKTINLEEEMIEEKHLKKEKPENLMFADAYKSKQVIRYAKTFELDGELYAVSNERFVKRFADSVIYIARSITKSYEIYHFKSGQRAFDEGEKTIVKTIEKFKKEIANWPEDKTNNYKAIIKKLPVIN